MEEIQRKTEKMLGSKNYKYRNDKELHGESPQRKVSTTTSKPGTRLQSRSSLIPQQPSPLHQQQMQPNNGVLYSSNSFQNANSYSKYRANYQPSSVSVCWWME